MEDLSWGGEPLQRYLDASDSARVHQVAKALVQAEKRVKAAVLRLQLERLLQRQHVEHDRSFNATILGPHLKSDLADKLFLELGGVGIVLYGYIHHTKGLEIQVLDLDKETLAFLIDAMDEFLKAQRGCKHKAIRGIDLWLEDRPLNACSDVFPDDLTDDKKRQEAIRNEKKNAQRRKKRKEQHGSGPGDLECFDGSSAGIQEDQNLQPALQPNTTRPYQYTIIQQRPSDINITSSYQSPYPRHAA